jgi:hypothetical protein
MLEHIVGDSMLKLTKKKSESLVVAREIKKTIFY